MARDYICVDGERRELAVEERRDGVLAIDDGEAVREVRLDQQRTPLRGAEVDGAHVEFGVVRRGDVWHVVIAGIEYRVAVDDARFEKLRRVSATGHGSGGGDGRLVAPIPGLVVRLLVAVGETVERGQPVLVLDAMKLENEIAAPRAGTVRAIHVAAGQAVEKDQLMLELE